MGGHGRSPAVTPGCGRFHGPAGAAGGEEGQAAMGTQTLIWARAVSAGTRGVDGGHEEQSVVFDNAILWRTTSRQPKGSAVSSMGCLPI